MRRRKISLTAVLTFVGLTLGTASFAEPPLMQVYIEATFIAPKAGEPLRITADTIEVQHLQGLEATLLKSAAKVSAPPVHYAAAERVTSPNVLMAVGEKSTLTADQDFFVFNLLYSPINASPSQSTRA